MKNWRLIGLCSALALTLLLGACDSSSGTPNKLTEKFINTDVTGLDYGKDFAMTDHLGRPRTLADFRGKVVIVFFGYTQCPDVCPTTMAEMSALMKRLGAQADKVQVLFVTLDPARDTQALLAEYVPNFDPRFLGLRGDQVATDKVAKEFKVFYQKVVGKSPDAYSIDHTAASYVFDPQGHLRLYLRLGQPTEAVAHDVKLLLQ